MFSDALDLFTCKVAVTLLWCAMTNLLADNDVSYTLFSKKVELSDLVSKKD